MFYLAINQHVDFNALKERVKVSIFYHKIVLTLVVKLKKSESEKSEAVKMTSPKKKKKLYHFFSALNNNLSLINDNYNL